jgi:drug/metabolite transporter (DMT)-like permease
LRAVVTLIIATVLWGVWGFADKNAVMRAHPFTVQWMYSLPYMLLIPFWFWLGHRAAPATNLDPSALRWATVASVAGMLALLAFLFAMEMKPASVAVAATAAYPLVTLLLSVLSGAETFSLPKLAGMVLIILGVVLVLNSK